MSQPIMVSPLAAYQIFVSGVSWIKMNEIMSSKDFIDFGLDHAHIMSHSASYYTFYFKTEEDKVKFILKWL